MYDITRLRVLESIRKRVRHAPGAEGHGFITYRDAENHISVSQPSQNCRAGMTYLSISPSGPFPNGADAPELGTVKSRFCRRSLRAIWPDLPRVIRQQCTVRRPAVRPNRTLSRRTRRLRSVELRTNARRTPDLEADQY